MADDIEWHGEAAKDHVASRARRFITAACLLVVRRAKELLSVPGTGVRVKAGLTKSAARAAKYRTARKRARILNKAMSLGRKAGVVKRKGTYKATKGGRIRFVKPKRRRKKKP